MTDETTQTPTEETPLDPVAEWLKTAPPEEILKNDRIAGIFGSRLQNERDRIRAEVNTESERKAAEKAEADLIALAQTDQYEFARKYLTDKEQERIRRELDQVKSSTRSEFAANLGRGYKALPEWGNLTPEEETRLRNAVAGKADDEFVVAFNAATLDIVAERRAQAKMSQWTEKELAKEREAIRQEESSKRLKNGTRPTLARAGGDVRPQDPSTLPDKEFREYYEKTILPTIGQRR